MVALLFSLFHFFLLIQKCFRIVFSLGRICGLKCKIWHVIWLFFLGKWTLQSLVWCNNQKKKSFYFGYNSKTIHCVKVPVWNLAWLSFLISEMDVFSLREHNAIFWVICTILGSISLWESESSDYSRVTNKQTTNSNLAANFFQKYFLFCLSLFVMLLFVCYGFLVFQRNYFSVSSKFFSICSCDSISFIFCFQNCSWTDFCCIFVCW